MDYLLANPWQPLVVFACYAIFWSWESIAPFFQYRGRLKHAARNLTVSVLNALILALLFSGLMFTIAGEVGRERLGLFSIVEIPLGARMIFSFVLLDLGMYWWHRMNHRIDFLWRFHRMHHSDPEVDVTSATRFHPGEIILSSTARLILIAVLAVPSDAIVLYDAIQLPVICFHHANIGLPRSLHKLLTCFIVSPFMHKIHHSRVKQETDSNFSSVLSVWDRVFGSYREADSSRGIRFGLEGFDGDERQSLAGLLKTPLSS